MMLPALIIGIALLSYFVRLLAMRLGLTAVILGQLVVVQPFVIAILYARLQTFDWSIVDSARDLGASPAHAFFTVTLAGDPADDRRRGADRSRRLAR